MRKVRKKKTGVIRFFGRHIHHRIINAKAMLGGRMNNINFTIFQIKRRVSHEYF